MTFPKLPCPTTIGPRYAHLKYFIALNLYEVAPLLPRLIGSIIEIIRYLGPPQCALSIIEGRSDDKTYQILGGLRDELEKLGVYYYLDSSSINPHGEDVKRISALLDESHFQWK